MVNKVSKASNNKNIREFQTKIISIHWKIILFIHQANAQVKNFCKHNQKKNLKKVILLKDKIISIEKVN